MKVSALICPLLMSSAVSVWAAAWPDPARFENSIAAFEAQDKVSPPPSGAIVVAGSSSIRMWHPDMGQDLAPLAVIPRGFGGSVMNDLAFYLPRVVLAYKPRALVIYEGDNDIAAGLSPEQVAASFKGIHSEVRKALPSCRIYLLSIKPSPSRWDKWDLMKEANKLLAADCARDKLARFVDVAGPMLDKDGKTRPELYKEDRLHMTREGYSIWVSVLKPILLADQAR